MLLASRLLQRSPLLPALSSLPAGLASYSVQIVVPPLGDSISDGAVELRGVRSCTSSALGVCRAAQLQHHTHTNHHTTPTPPPPQQQHL
jgi:hypothetical protein